MSQAPSEMPDFQKLTAYTRLPHRLEQAYPQVAALQKYDKYGVFDRLQAIKDVLGGRHLGNTIDLGGNSGYFCLSLIDGGMITKATVYDASADALEAGRMMARMMGICKRIDFVKQLICLDFVRDLRRVDTIICLNLLHHAGSNFDVELVEREGWERYAQHWLSEMRMQCTLAIFGMHFEANEPVGWDVPLVYRPVRFARLAEQAGWSILYDANVEDIQALGVDRAHGRYSQGDLARRARKRPPLIKKLRSLRNALYRLMGIEMQINKRHRYFLYILENSCLAPLKAPPA